MTTGDWISVAVAVGTIGLASAAFWQIIRGAMSQPRLSLEREEIRIHTRLEGEPPVLPWIRLVVRNAEGRRVATGTRVLVDQYRQTTYDTPPVSLGGPELGWPSTDVPLGGGAIVFGGTTRPLDFGALGVGPIQRPQSLIELMGGREALPAGHQWWFRFTLAMHGGNRFIGREFLPPVPGGYTARLTVGADEGRASTFDAVFSWVGDAPTAESALGSFLITIEPVRPRPGLRQRIRAAL